MQFTPGKALGSLVAFSYAVGMIVRSGGVTGHVVMGWGALLLPLAFIWFPDEIGGITGCFGIGRNVDTKTPPVVVSFVGWFFLVGFPLAFFLLG
jgi:hypothetical protein